MNDFARLEEEADYWRHEFFRTTGELKDRFSPTRLADEAIAKADPGFRALRSMEASVRRNPVLALAIVVAMWRLIKDAGPPLDSPGSPSRRPRKASPSSIPLEKKERLDG